MTDISGHAPGRITALYLVVAAAWIFLSDRALLALGLSVESLSRLQTIKGLLFILITGTLLYGVLRRTFRRLSEVLASLRDSEGRFRALVESTPDWVWEVDADGRYTYVSPRCRDLLGYAPEALLGRTPFDLMAPEESRRIRQVFAELARHKAPIVALENTNRHSDGHDVILETSGRPVLDARGTLLGYRGIDRDVTERRRAEQALRDSEQLFRTIFEQAGVGVALIASADGRLLRANQRFCDIAGLDADRLDRVSITDVVHPDDLAADREQMQRLLSGERRWYALQERYVRPDGTAVWVQVSVAATWNPGDAPTNHITIVEDITARKQAEQALTQEYEKVNLILNTTLEGYLLIDPAGRILDVNPAYCAMVGYPPEHLRGMDLHILEPQTPPERIRQRIDGAVATGHARFEVRHRRADGRLIDLDVSISRMTAADGPLLAAFVRDVTQQKRAARELREAHERLEERVAARTAELSVANRELESFTYSVTHDLRAPLRAIRGFSQALIDDYGDTLPAGARGFLAQIETGSIRMGELIDGLLALSRHARGEVCRAPVDLSAIARELLRELAAEDSTRRVAIQVEEGLTADADPRLVKTLLANLLGNAWKYTGGRDAPEIRVYAVEKEGERVICIEDNGAGFDMAFAAKLFEPFQRLHHQDEFPGIGIGLATVQRIVHRHGGWIEGKGTPGRGAVFCFTLTPQRRPRD